MASALMFLIVGNAVPRRPNYVSYVAYVLAVSVTKPRSGLMSLCSYVLLFTALAAAKLRYGVSPYVS